MTENSENVSDQTREASLCAHYHHVSTAQYFLSFFTWGVILVVFSNLISDLNIAKRDLSSPEFQLLKEIGSVVTNPRAPLQLHRQKTCSVGLERAEFQTLVPTLEAWAQQLHLLKVNTTCLQASKSSTPALLP